MSTNVAQQIEAAYTEHAKANDPNPFVLLSEYFRICQNTSEIEV